MHGTLLFGWLACCLSPSESKPHVYKDLIFLIHLKVLNTLNSAWL